MSESDQERLSLSHVTVRPATIEDSLAIARAHVNSWQAAFSGLLPDNYLTGLSVSDRQAMWLARLGCRDSQERVFVAETTNKTLGFAAVGPCEDEDINDLHAAQLDALYLIPEAWGQGIGKRLHQVALSWLRSEGYRMSTLWVHAGNSRAKRFYEGSGWRSDGASKREVRGGSAFLQERYRYKL